MQILHKVSLHWKTFSTSTCPFDIRIIKYKFRTQFILGIIHFGSKKRQLRLPIDNNANTILNYLLVQFGLFLRIV